jgi:hypothetical protein
MEDLENGGIYLHAVVHTLIITKSFVLLRNCQGAAAFGLRQLVMRQQDKNHAHPVSIVLPSFMPTTLKKYYK